MSIFKLEAPYQPQGDQPQAIKKLVQGLKKGDRFQTLLGVTGSGKTFTMANVLSFFDQPVLVIAPNKALAAQLYHEYKNFFLIIQSIILFLIMIIISQKLIYQLLILISKKRL